MTWFRADDTLESHPKVRSIPRRQRFAAMGLWTLAGTWCARHLTDGRISASECAEKDRPRCDVCQGALDAPLLAREHHTTHPACDPDAAAALTRARAERARQAARERTSR